MKRMKGALARDVAYRIAKATATILLAALTLPHSSSAQQRDPLAGFDAYVVKGMQDWKIPGLAVGIVKNDSVIFARGFGVRTLGRLEKIDEHTLFAIAFGGMGYSRQELLRRIRYLKPSWSMRSRYGYSNLMYVAAGEVAAAVERKPWDDIVRARIFAPLGMTSTNTSVTLLPRLQNVATLHASFDSAVRAVNYTDADNIASAGAINSSAADMAKWIRFQLDSGRVRGKRLVSKRNFVERASFDSIEAKDLRDKAARRVAGTKPSLPLARYAGGYSDSLYGRSEVRMENGHLVLALAPKQIGDLDYWHFDTFKVTWRDHRDGWNLVTFALDTEGGVDTLRADIGGLPEEWPVMKRLPDATTASATNRQ